MKNQLKKIAVLLCVGMISISSQLSVTYAAEGSQDVIVSYSPTEDELARYKMRVDIIGSGSVFDGTQELRENSSIYELKFEEQKIFKISPDKGYHLKSIVYDGNDITYLLQEDGTIVIEGMDYDTLLTFTYEVDAVLKPEKPGEDSKPPVESDKGQNKGPQTGDSINNDLFVSTMLLSGAGIFFVLYKKKKDEEEEIEEQR